jgi:transposase-like protein
MTPTPLNPPLARGEAAPSWIAPRMVETQRTGLPAPGSSPALGTREEALAQLRRENQQLRLERDILRKAMAFVLPRPS